MSWPPFANQLVGSNGENLGSSVSFSEDGSIMAVGSPQIIVNGAGSVQVYQYNSGDNVWGTYGSALVGTAAGDAFGSGVYLSADGNTLAVYYKNIGSDVMGLRLFKYSAGTWNVSDGGDITGLVPDLHPGFISLSANGQRVAIGNGPEGAVRIYSYNSSTNTWPLHKGAITPGIGGNFGTGVSLNSEGTSVFIGAPSAGSVIVTPNGEIIPGQIFVYSEGSSSWGLDSTINAPGSASSEFGRKVKVSSNASYLIATAFDNGTNQSYVSLFQKFGSTYQHISAVYDGSHTFGETLSFSRDGTVFAVGNVTEGKVYVYNVRIGNKGAMIVPLYNGLDQYLSGAPYSFGTGLDVVSSPLQTIVAIGSPDGPSDGSLAAYRLIPTPPGAPTLVSVTGGDTTASVSFTASPNDGGSPVTTFTAYATDIAGVPVASVNGASSPLLITGLTNNVTYRIKISATNSVGESPMPAFGDATVTPTTASSVPNAPSITSVTAGNTTITVNFMISAPMPGDPPITNYTATVYLFSEYSSYNPMLPGPPLTPVNIQTGISSPITIGSLANDVDYVVTVYATNENGNSVESAASAPVMPTGGGMLGDPYVTTASGAHYKLPTLDAPIRVFQGEVEGKTLTVNAQLRTIPNTELMASNFRSYFDLKSKVPTAKLKVLEKSVLNTETLCFFEKFYISHGGVELVLNVWDQKFKVESYLGGRFPSTVIDGEHLMGRCSNIYKDYKSQTVKLQIGRSASVLVSVYDAPMVRNGIFLEGIPLARGNGAMVNVLSSKDMTLGALDSATPVVKRDAPLYVKREAFIDKDGYREKKIYITK